jgi:hypothetical protein
LNGPLVKGAKATMRSIFLALVLTMGLSQTTCTTENSAVSGPRTEPPIAPSKQMDGMKIKIKVEDKTVTATLIDSKTTRDFVSLLPLTLTMNDLFKREKFARLPRAISEEGQRTRTYEVGEIVYWSPGPDLAVFYRHDGQAIPSPGIIVIGRIDSGVEAFNSADSVRATFEIDQTSAATN